MLESYLLTAGMNPFRGIIYSHRMENSPKII